MIEKLDSTSNNVPRRNLPKQKTKKLRIMMWQAEQDPKQVISSKMLETGLGPSYKPSVTQVVKKSSSLCMM
jgi:hypothetical protein